MALSLHVNGVSKRFNRPLFEGVDLVVSGSAHIGLIGDNGSGKSTFLRILAGMDNTDAGEVVWSKDAKIGYLEQEIVADTFDVSGGEKKILKITELFYGDYNVILLDEPDNHLDLDHKLWFEQLVREFEGIVIVISHDRGFLETSVDKIWNLDETKITNYEGSYTKFRDIYEGERESRLHLWETQEKERVRLLDVVERFRIKAATNSKLARRYSSMVKRYDKWVDEMVDKPVASRTLNLQLDLDRQHKRKTALHIKELKKSYGGIEVLRAVNLHLFCKEKIAISAPNGSGKSTLLNILVGKNKEDEGSIRVGDGLKIGYYAQEHLEALDENISMVEELQKSGRFSWFDAIAYLKKFLFTETQAKMEVKWLSGGQKSRLQLAKFLATNPDILILDEPTNHLDLKTVLALERFLKNYEGTLILVSHDRELVDNVVDKVFDLKDGLLIEIG